jgi:hypothetical protein
MVTVYEDSLGSIVRYSKRFFLILELDDGSNGSENLFPSDLLVIRHSREHGRLNKVTLISESFTTNFELGLLLSGFDVVHNLVELDLGDERTVECLWIFTDINLEGQHEFRNQVRELLSYRLTCLTTETNSLMNSS